MKIENIAYSTIGNKKGFTIEIVTEQNEQIFIGIPFGKLDKPSIINELVRAKYSQDSVEALINNHLMLLSEWQEQLLGGNTKDKLIDVEYDELQNWRKECKELANVLIEEINKLN